ncbi:MAG: PqqD family protein [Atopobiaceae bacterium]
MLRHIGNTWILVPIKRNTIGQKLFYLNEAGAWIWKNAAAYDSVDDLASALLPEMSKNDQETNEGVRSFCHSLLASGLLTEE